MTWDPPGNFVSSDPGREVRGIWRQPDGGVIIWEQEIEPRRWWNRVTRPLGILLILAAIAWPLVLLAHGWPRLGLGFAVADLCLVSTGRDLMRWGAKRWREEGD
ncbi:hypothetical protein QE385_001721 [Sphingomonas sp. SORGH_AS 950]|uniref:hypothetical protein n=1 Tax=Sphingomonas sp. SORGH_AS_0950 TaxID=3041792 RepID=UPI00277FF06D|nr:hypothetical protein [Sphingomonas sp. SORGH_AS_0950]MDQ1157394.1 hypothetical protein [Sphingomonas sp. SORGH_AS_0950]